MKYSFYFLFFGLFTGSSFAQQFLWAKEAHYTYSKGIFCDKNGDVYNYGSSFQVPDFSTAAVPQLNDTTGSYLARYAADGTLISVIRWRQPFYISDIAYDGESSLYVTGFFGGTQNLNGHQISATGSYDGFVAKMNMQGVVQWAHSLGGSQNDCLNSITLNNTKNRLVTVGGLSGSLYQNGSLLSSFSERSMLVAEFDLQGNLQQHRLLDYAPGRNNGNCGYSVNSDKSGSYYLLHQREGKAWSGDSSNLPDEGRYLSCLDQDLEETWSTFIINGACYYGYECRRMAQSSNGDSYISTFCSGKYGGTGLMRRYGATTGAFTWSLSNTDGRYRDVHCDGDNMYMIGNEEANGCPCEDNNPGHEVVKKLNVQNQLLGEARFKDVELMHITTNQQGMIYVLGSYRKDVTVGDKQFTYSGNGVSYFLMGLADVDCEPAVVQASTKNACAGETVQLMASEGIGYRWSNGSKEKNISVNSPGVYWVEVEQGSGCKALSLPVKVQFTETPTVSLLAASFEKATSAYEIEWYHTGQEVKSYRLYREQHNKSKLISEFTERKARYIFSDHEVSSNGHAAYYVTATDSCGNESIAAERHKTVHLSFEMNGSRPAVSWTGYEGFPYSKFYIFRGENAHALRLIDSVDTDVLSYTDSSEPAPYYYQVMVQQNPDRRSFSNISEGWSAGSDMVPSGVAEGLMDDMIEVYPNPSDDVVYLQIHSDSAAGKIFVSVRNVLGQEVLQKIENAEEMPVRLSLNLSSFKRGLYFVTIRYAHKTEVRQILLK